MFVFIAINLNIIQMICVRSLLVTPKKKKNPIKEALFQEALNYRYPFVDVVDVSTSV